MKMKDIWAALNSWAPFDTAEEWDNSGMQVEMNEEDVTGILVTLDVTKEAVKKAAEYGTNVIVSHHPILFHPPKTVTDSDVLYKLIQNGIGCIAAHTNLDKASGGVNDCLCEALNLHDATSICNGIGRVAKLDFPMDAVDFGKTVSSKLNTGVQMHLTKKTIQSVAMVCGGGGDFVSEAMLESGADAFLTGEVKHHEWIDNSAYTIYSAGHFATENVVVKALAAFLQKSFPQIPVKVFDEPSPYQTII